MAKGNFNQSGFNRIIADEVEVERMQFTDDFMEAAAALASTVISKSYWTGGGTSGTQAIIAGVNGIMQLDTTSTGSRTSTLTFSTANFDVASNPSLEVRVALSNLTNCKYEFGWYVGANDYVLFRFDSAVSSTRLLLVTKKNGGSENVQTLYFAPTAGKYFKARLELLSDATYKAVIGESETKNKYPYLDIVNQDIRSYSGSIRSLATFVPYFYASNKTSAEQKLLNIDYVKVSQDRDV